MSDDVGHEEAIAELALLVERRRLASARSVLASALPKNPDSPELLYFSACIDWLDDMPEAARKTVQRALEIDPAHFDARLLLAQILDELGEHVDAERTILELLKEYPEEPELYAVYAALMLNTYNVDKAERLAAEALRRDPQHARGLTVHVLCGFIKHPGKEQQRRLGELLKTYPDQVNSVIRLIQYQVDNGETRQAYRLARELVQIAPDDPGIVSMATNLKRAAHWSLIPLWPMQKWGWGGSIAIWFGAVALFQSGVLDKPPLDAYQGVVLGVLLGYVVYSWVWPPILNRLLD